MPMTRILLMFCALIPVVADAQTFSPRARPPSTCPTRPVECQINAPVFDFGRGQMSVSAPPAYAHAIISVTCTRAPIDGLDVDVSFELQAQPPAPARQMRNQTGGFLGYDMYLDPARTRYWGDGSQGTFPITGTLMLDDRNRVGTLAFPLYGKVPGGQQAVLAGQWLGAVVSRLLYSPDCK